MTEKTTVGVDKELRKTIKRLAAWLDTSQGEVIKSAILDYEKKIFSEKRNSKLNKEDSKIDINWLLEAATETIWAEDLETKKIQQTLMQSSETIDDFIIDNWDSGL